jgi:hypothetical protein
VSLEPSVGNTPSTPTKNSPEFYSLEDGLDRNDSNKSHVVWEPTTRISVSEGRDIITAQASDDDESLYDLADGDEKSLDSKDSNISIVEENARLANTIDKVLGRSVGSASDLFQQHKSSSRTSLSPRFHSTSGSVSSTASGPRNSLHGSTLSVTERSSITNREFKNIDPGLAALFKEKSVDELVDDHSAQFLQNTETVENSSDSFSRAQYFTTNTCPRCHTVARDTTEYQIQWYVYNFVEHLSFDIC